MVSPTLLILAAGMGSRYGGLKQMDPIGVGARDLRECLLAQLQDLKRVNRKNANGNHVAELEALDDAMILVDQHLHALQNKH